MKKALLFLFALSAASAISTSGQTSFLPSAFSTANDDLFYDFDLLPNGKKVFVGTHLKPTQGYKWADGIIFITDQAGDLVRQRVFTHAGDSVNMQCTQVYTTDSTIEVFGLEGFVDYPLTLLGPVNQTIVWTKLDTMLNVIEQKRFTLATSRQALAYLKTVRYRGSTYGLITLSNDYLGNPNNQFTRLLKFDPDMNLVMNEGLDAQFYSTALNVNGSSVNDISVDMSTSSLFLTGYVRITTALDSSFWPSNILLHKVDTFLNLVDTFQVRRFSTTGLGTDTFLYQPTQTLPLSNARVFIGPILSVTTFNPTSSSDRVGLSTYNTNTRRHTLRATAPRVNSADEQTANVYTKAIAYDGGNSVYAIGTSHWLINFFNPIFGESDNKIVVVKYDTSGNLIWHRFLGNTAGYYTGSVIRCEGDSVVTIVAGRYDYVNSPNDQQRDFYVLRLRAADGTPTAVFPITRNPAAATVFPNPATSTLHIRLPKAPATQAPVTLYGPTGAAVRQTSLTGTETAIPIADLPPGVYSYRITSADGPGDSGLFLKQ